MGNHFAFYRCTRTKTFRDLCGHIIHLVEATGFWGAAGDIYRVDGRSVAAVNYESLLGGIADHRHPSTIPMHQTVIISSMQIHLTEYKSAAGMRSIW